MNKNKNTPHFEEGFEPADLQEQPAGEVDTTVTAPVAQETVVTTVVEPAVAKPVSLPVGLKDSSIEDLNLDEKAAATRASILAEPRIMVIVPLMNGEKNGTYKSVNINGWRVSVRKNTPVELPVSIWELISQNMKASFENTAENPLNLNNADAGAKAALGFAK